MTSLPGSDPQGGYPPGDPQGGYPPAGPRGGYPPPYGQQPPYGQGQPSGQPYGQPGGYPAGSYPLGAPAPKRSRTGLIVGIVAAVAAVCLLGAGVVGVIGWRAAHQDGGAEAGPAEVGAGEPWERQLRAIDGVADYRSAGTLAATHASGLLDYPQNPPVGGVHNAIWQTCTGRVYTASIPKEHAVHSLEHGAVWITYSPALDAAGVAALAGKVTGVDYTMLSPVPSQSSPVSVQAWGYQLQVGSAGDPRIDRFIRAARVNASLEPGATCSGGNSATGPEPRGDAY